MDTYDIKYYRGSQRNRIYTQMIIAKNKTLETEGFELPSAGKLTLDNISDALLSIGCELEFKIVPIDGDSNV